MVIGGAIGATIGAIAGAALYTYNNQQTFDVAEYRTAVIGGAVAGALLGSGLGALTVGVAGTATTAATFAVGAGTAATLTEADYMTSNKNSFNTKEYVVNSSVSAAVGGTTAIAPIIAPTAGMATAIKAAIYIGGAELQYGLLTKNVTTRGVLEAGMAGVLSTALDFGTNKLFNSSFVPDNTRNALAVRNNPTMQNSVLDEAIKFQSRFGYSNFYNGLVSGSASWYGNRKLREYMDK
jgi:hypothetical protein